MIVEFDLFVCEANDDSFFINTAMPSAGRIDKRMNYRFSKGLIRINLKNKTSYDLYVAVDIANRWIKAGGIVENYNTGKNRHVWDTENVKVIESRSDTGSKAKDVHTYKDVGGGEFEHSARRLL